MRTLESIIFPAAFLIFSIPACVIDIRQRRIPDWTVFLGLVVLITLRFFSLRDSAERILLDMISGFLFLFGIRFLTKGKLGMGDVKFAALMGVFIGFPGLFVATGLASLLGLMFALIGIYSGRINNNSKIPFAPFLTVGSIYAYFVNYDILLKI